MQATTVSCNKNERGFSLIEILVSVAILAIVMIALLEAAALYTKVNMNNILRDEAVRVTQDTMYNLRTSDFTNLVDKGTIDSANSCVEGTGGLVVNRTIRNLRTVTSGGEIAWQFDVCVKVARDIAETRATVKVVTSYTLLQQRYSHQASIVVSR